MKEFLGLVGKEFTMEDLKAYKELLEECQKPTTVNNKLMTINNLIKRSGIEDIKIKLLDIRKCFFITEDDILTPKEIKKLLNQSLVRKDRRLYYLMKVYLATGIRVSEHQYVTVEALEKGVATVKNKGSERQVILPKGLVRRLKGYAHVEGIESGPIFITKNGNPVDRRNIWAQIQKIGLEAGIKKEKLHAHNFRHYFARKMYEIDDDVVKISALLGHSSVETTRTYLKVLVSECKEKIDQLEEVMEEEIGEDEEFTLEQELIEEEKAILEEIEESEETVEKNEKTEKEEKPVVKTEVKRNYREVVNQINIIKEMIKSIKAGKEELALGA